MPWFTTWPESIKKRACRYLLQHYLGQFLQEKLSLEQLSVDLYNGTGHVSNVPLDIWSLNDFLDQARVPIELVDGYIGSILVNIPWSSLLSDNCKVEIRGLEITLQPKYRNDTEVSNMTDSFYWSLGNMTTSMQLAEECLKGQEQGTDSQNAESGGLFEGLEVFAQTIESVISRVKVSLLDTVIRIEHLPEDSKTGIGLEIHINKIDYFDEKTMSASEKSSKPGNQSRDADKPVYEGDSITCKRFRATGIKVLLDEFPEQMRTSPRGSVDAFPNEGTDMKNTADTIQMSCSPDMCFKPPVITEQRSEASNDDVECNGPFVIGQLFGCQELKLRIKQNDHVSVPKIDAECYLGSFSMFLTPQQVHLLTELATGVISPTSSICPDSNAGHNFTSESCHNMSADHGIKLSPPEIVTFCEDDPSMNNEEQFFSMEASKISLTANLPPIEAQSESNMSLYSSDSIVTGYTLSSVSTLSHAGGTLTQPVSKVMGVAGGNFSPATMARDIAGQASSRNTAPNRYRSTNFGEDKSGFNNCHYQFQISALAVTILHVNPLPPSGSPFHTSHSISSNDAKSSSTSVDGVPGETPLMSLSTKTKYLSDISDGYFECCKNVLKEVINKDLPSIRNDLSSVVCSHDHLRLIATHVHLNSHQKTAFICHTEVSIGRAEVTECLFNEPRSNRNLPCSARKKKNSTQKENKLCKDVIYSEILVFDDLHAPMQPMDKSMYSGAAPNIKIHISSTDKHRFSKTSLYIHLSECHSEIDISIVDRLSTLLYPADLSAKQLSNSTSLFSPTSTYTHHAINRQAVFTEALADDSKEKILALNVSASYLKINFRFPIADLRPEIERRPWYTRSLRDEILVLEACDIAFVTSSLRSGMHPASRARNGTQWSGTSPSLQQSQKFEVTVKDLHVLYSDELDKPAKSFLRICQSADDMEPMGSPMDDNSDLDCPHIKITINPSQEDNINILRAPGSLVGPNQSRFNSTKSEDANFPCFDDDFPMTGSQENQPGCIPSPFSQRKVIYDNEEMILPGDASEIQAFCDHAISTAQVSISLHLPAVNVFLVSKSFFENLYNRINNDILLWEPAAPKPHRRGKNGFDSRTVSYLDYVYPDKGLDLASQLLLNSQAPDYNIQNDSSEFTGIDSDSDDTNEDYNKDACVGGNKKSQKTFLDSATLLGKQSLIAVTIRIGYGCVSVRCNQLLDDGSCSNAEHGEIVIMLENSNIFNVASYCGNPLLDYVCVQINCCSLYHKASLPSLPTEYSVVPKLTTALPDHLDLVFGCSNEGISSSFASGTKIGTGPDSHNMVTVAIKIETEDARPMKHCLVSTNFSGVMLHFKFAKAGQSWLEQLMDFIDATDDQVLGYEPPSFITEMHLNVRDSAAVYTPIYLSPAISVVLTASSFSLSSNIVATAPISVLRIVVDESNLFISDRCCQPSIDLQQHYVCILDISVFEICLKLSNKTCKDGEDGYDPERQYPLIDLQASNNMVRLRTCADSCAALSALLRYLAEDGDLVGEDRDNEFDDALSEYSINNGSTYFAATHSPMTNSNIANNSFTKEQGDLEMQLIPEAEDTCDNELPELMADAMEEVFVDAKSDFCGTTHKRDPIVESLYDFSTSTSNLKPEYNMKSAKSLLSQSVMVPNPHRTKKNQSQRSHLSNRSNAINKTWTLDDDEFCIINDPGMGLQPRDGEPEVKYRALPNDEDLDASHIYVQENYFKPAFGKVDQLRAPEHFPVPVVRYALKELSCVWCMYGGTDFTSSDKKQERASKDSTNQQCSPKMSKSSHEQLKSNVHKGCINYGKLGSGRDSSMLMEVHLKKVSCQHEQYPDDTYEAQRTVLIVSDFEVRDRLQSSCINKLLYRFHSEASPKQAHAKTLLVKALQIRPEGPGTPPECRLRVSLQPLRLNVDQDTMSFLTKFFTDLSISASDEAGSPSNRVAQSTAYETAPGSSTASVCSSPKMHAAPYASPIMTRPSISAKNDPSTIGTTCYHSLGVDRPTPKNIGSKMRSSGPLKQNPIQQPLFFRELVFSPEVPIRLDYHGKRIDTEQGTIAGLLMGLGQLNCSQLKLKRVVHRHGLLGVNKLISFLLNEWAADIRANQLPLILGGVGPMHSVVQLFQGVRDLVCLPVEQYRKDGRIVRGLQRGATSFGTSTAMATLEITNRAIGLIQSAAETAYELVSPPELHRHDRHAQRNWRTLGNHAIRRQPADIREGMSNALTVVRHGVQDTAGAILRVAQMEHERKGVTGAVGGVLRHIPPALVRPVIMASEATTNVLSGIRNQIQPDAKQQDEDKWKDMESVELSRKIGASGKPF